MLLGILAGALAVIFVLSGSSSTAAREVRGAGFISSLGPDLPPALVTDSSGHRDASHPELRTGPDTTTLKAVLRDSLVLSDTTRRLSKHARDSLARADSIRRVPRDSTARIAQFLYRRTDSPVVDLFEQRTYSMFDKPPSLLIRSVVIDSTGRYVIVRETVNGVDVRIPDRIPLEEYINQRYKYEIERGLEDEVYKYDVLKKKNDLGDILGSFTNIDIPIPANPVFSIFGPPRINLHISGAVDIHAAFTNTKTDEVTLSSLGSTQNTPDFSQQVQINVSGTIGDKLNILADWNTQRTFEYENQLKIKYTGYDDEIVQSVEAGNVSLATNSAFISPSSALFGIKSTFLFGPLKITGIATQKKGQIQQKNISGGTSEKDFTIHAYEYNTDHYFLDTSYIPLFEQYYTTHQGDPRKQIVDYQVWVTNTQIGNTTARQGVAFIDLDTNQAHYTDKLLDTLTSIPGRSESGLWVQLVNQKDYTIQPYAGFLTLNISLQPGQAVAMAYRVENGPGPADDSYYGTFTGSGSVGSLLVLKLIKPKTLLPQDTVAWRLLMKNIYSLGGRDISKSGFELHIYYTLPGKQPVDEVGGVKLLQLFGFDNLKDDNTPGSDNNFDYNPPYTIDESRGEIIFPTVEPFLGTRTDPSRGPLVGGLKKAFDHYGVTAPVDSFSYGDVYDTTLYGAQNNTLKDRFTIVGKTTAGSSNTINLGFNIVENSVQVLLNGQPLTANVDYTVDYIVGQIIIKNQAALVPGANLQVKYEQNDLFQLASKTLLGTRAELTLSDKTAFGFTLMNLNQQTLTDKVRVDEEPTNNTIYGMDAQTGGRLDFLTKAIDALPLIATKAPSEFNIKGEVAEMSPDPNTKKSTIGIDKGKAIAYVDDFEGALKTIPFGVSYGSWHDMSVPAYQEGVDANSISLGLISDSAKLASKAKAFWYTIPNSVPVLSIWPNKSVAQGENLATVMHVVYDPKGRGAYNYSPSLRQTLLAHPEFNWAGMERTLSTGIVDLIQENVNFIEIWMKIDPGTAIDTAHNRVFIDLGAISEDVIPGDSRSKAGMIHTEDNEIAPNGAMSDEKDTGIDRLTDDQERAAHPDFITANQADFPDVATDPAGDDYQTPTNNDYSHVNGTENNYKQKSEIGLNPDADDLNRNNVLDKTNSYFEYQLNLDTTKSNPQRVGGGANGWYQYRIPLIDWKNKVGTPDFSLVEFARMWFTGFTSGIHLEIAQFDLVGNQWQELVQHDSTFQLSVTNIEDNPDYISPPGVSRARDLTKPDQQVYENEQALVLQVHKLHPGDSRQAIKRFNVKPLDMFNYRELKMFVRGDPSFSSNPNSPSAYIFMRIGADSLNYYEYREPIMPSVYYPTTRAGEEAAVWNPLNNIDIKFADMTKLKQGRDTSGALVREATSDGPPGSTYAVLGNPTLTDIEYISVGIENPASSSHTIDSANVWINELRLCDVDDSKGWAYSVSTSLKLADLGNVSFSFSTIDPNFHQLEDRFGSRTTSTNWSLLSSFALEKFFPTSWTGTTLPFSYSHTESRTQPKYLPSSDILVTQAAQEQDSLVARQTGSEQAGTIAGNKLIFESETYTKTDTYALPTIKFNVPSESWVLRDLFNRLTYGFSYTKSFTRSPNITYQIAWSWSAHMSYGYVTAPDNFILPFAAFYETPILRGLKNLRIYYPLQNVTISLDASRAQTHVETRDELAESPPSRTLSAHRSMSLGWKLTENGLLNVSGDYSVDVTSTLVHLETDQNNNQRQFSSILGDLFMKDQLISFGHDNGYNQTININTKPKVPELFDLNKYFTISAHYSVSYHWQNNFQQGDLGKGTSWANSVTLSSDISLKQFVETWWPAAKAGPEQPEGATSHRVGRGRGHEDDEDLRDVLGPQEQQPQQQQPQQEQQQQQLQQLPQQQQQANLPAGRDSSQTRDTTKAFAPVARGKIRISPKEFLSNLARYAIKFPLLDYDKINVNFTESDNATNSGVPGRPGFANLFGRVPFVQDGDPRFGPTRSYQLGLVSDPAENVSGLQIQSAFPFFRFATSDAGLRAPLASISNSYSQNNKVTLHTSRELFTNFHLDLNWDVGWNFSRTQNLTTDSMGVSTITSTATAGSIERSFFTLPPTFIFSSFKSGIGQVGKEYAALQAGGGTLTDDAKISQAFENGFESIPVFRKIFGQFFPRVNYSLHWDGLEQLSIFRNFATHVGLDHTYTSNYQESFHGDPSGNQITDAQHITYGFSPLIGLNFTFKELLKGNMSATMRYATTSSFDLTPSSSNIVENDTKEISISASYGRTGFEIPFFGLSLSNDIDLTLTYSYSDNSRITYTAIPYNTESNTGGGLDGGVPGDGSSRSITEPRIRYVLSARVTASLFYRYTKVTPDAGGSRIPGSTTNEGGLDVHVAIQ
ncbi:MAG TPA: cell surface protein SprA [Bacteroidota bacterium]|nr:cell surface protein SprA [Bacteroidota bacterium]